MHKCPTKKSTWQCLGSCKLAGSEYDASSGLVYQTQLPVGLFLQPLHDSTGSRGSTAPRTLVCSSQHVIIFCRVHVCLFPMWKDEHLKFVLGCSKTSYDEVNVYLFRNIFIYSSYKKTFRNNFSQHLLPSASSWLEVFIYHLQLQLLPWHVPPSWSCPLPYFFGASSHVPTGVTGRPVGTTMSHRCMVENMPGKSRSKCGHLRPVPWHDCWGVGKHPGG